MMKEHEVGSVMVVDHGRLVGIFTERDALYRVMAEGRDAGTVTLADVMTAHPQTVSADKPVGHALLMMYEGGYRHVPVVKDGRPGRHDLGPRRARSRAAGIRIGARAAEAHRRGAGLAGAGRLPAPKAFVESRRKGIA